MSIRNNFRLSYEIGNTAVNNWKMYYRSLTQDLYDGTGDEVEYDRMKMEQFRREAALERQIAALQRRIEYLEDDLKLAQHQVAESEERREFAARLEFGA